MIAWSLYITFIGALAVLLLPRNCARWLALLTAVAGAGVAAWEFLAAPLTGEWRTLISVPWIPSLGINFHLAADGISLTMALVTGFTAVSAVLMSWNVARRGNEFFFWLLLVIGGSYGVFLSADLFLLFVFYELVIIPKYFLIATWGSINKAYGAMKLTLYSFLGGALVLIGLLVAWLQGGSFDLQILSAHAFAPQTQAWVFPVMFLGFAILAGIWPLHTWAPAGHSAAPTAGSMLLAGVVMKLGAYGALRVAMNLFPQGFEMWRGTIAVFAVAGICLASAVALRQRDLKYVIGYSSVSHMGFVLLGLATAQTLGLGGAVLQMFSHGVIAGLLFAVAGRMLYDRTHTRDLAALGGMNLTRALPFAAFTFTVASAASMGIPGFSGFAAEITILLGAWKAFPMLVLVTGAGMVLTAAFTLRALKAVFFADAPATDAPHHFEPMTLAEISAAWLLMAATLGAGLFPKLFLDRILPCVEAMRCLKP
jgi:NADH-quinone oxidoreductase subunit M